MSQIQSSAQKTFFTVIWLFLIIDKDISLSEAVQIFVPANFKRPLPVFHSKAAATNPAALRKTNKRIVTNYSKDKVIAC